MGEELIISLAKFLKTGRDSSKKILLYPLHVLYMCHLVSPVHWILVLHCFSGEFRQSLDTVQMIRGEGSVAV